MSSGQSRKRNDRAVSCDFTQGKQGYKQLFDSAVGVMQRLCWTCLKSESEIQREFPHLPASELPFEDIPYPNPDVTKENTNGLHERFLANKNEETHIWYFYLAEISLRRFAERMRLMTRDLAPQMSYSSFSALMEEATEEEDLLGRWVQCRPPTLEFPVPISETPDPNETEQMHHLRMRYILTRELQVRSYLYFLVNSNTEECYPEHVYRQASICLQLNMQRILTENAFYRHHGTWLSIRGRFTSALILVAGYRTKILRPLQMAQLELPEDWELAVHQVVRRLRLWETEGLGIREMADMLEELTEGDMFLSSLES